MKSLINRHAGAEFMVIGAGSTVKHFQNGIARVIEEKKLITIGINNITGCFVPYYHLWTNNGRLKEFLPNINHKSRILLGNSIRETLTGKVGKYEEIKYADAPLQRYKYDPKQQNVRGHFRTAGNLAIYLSWLMGASMVYCVGFDGYGLKYGGSQHCYGEGMTDGDDVEYQLEKDSIVQGILDRLSGEGVDFSIMTPTVFKNHYSGYFA